MAVLDLWASYALFESIYLRQNAIHDSVITAKIDKCQLLEGKWDLARYFIQRK